MPELTRCWLDTCGDVGHVVLYASADRFAGQQTRQRQEITLCLKHGGQVYDVIREWDGRVKLAARLHDVPRDLVDSQQRIMKHSAACPAWLAADLRNDRLPRTSPDPRGWPQASAMALNRRGKR